MDLKVSVPSHEIYAAHHMCFGVSCAFAALQLISKKRLLNRKFHVGEMMLTGNAQLMGLLVWTAQRREEGLNEKLMKVEREVLELKCQRAEDAKANEKVVRIFAAHQQNWLSEKKRLDFQIQGLVRKFQVQNTKHDETVTELSKNIEESVCLLSVKEEALQEECERRMELEEMLTNEKEEVEKVKRNASKEVQDHMEEILRHKTVIDGLVSHSKKVEAEIRSTLQQLQAVTEELAEVSDRREEDAVIVEKLSREIEKLKYDAKQKEKILSEMLRKPKLDMAERNALLKEMNVAKTRNKRVELEKDRWRTLWETSHKKSFRELYSSDAGSSHKSRAGLKLNNDGYSNKNPLMQYFLDTETTQQRIFYDAREEQTTDSVEWKNGCSRKENNNLGDIQHLQHLFCKDADRYVTIIKQRHYSEMEAFGEQQRLKEEKIETLQWQFLSLELELKRLHSHTEGLNGTVSKYREEIFRIESLLFNKDKKLNLLKDQISFYLQQYQPCGSSCFNKMKTAERKSRKREEETKIIKETISTFLLLEQNKEITTRESTDYKRTTTLTDLESPIHHSEDHTIKCIYKQFSEETQRTDGLLLNTGMMKEEVKPEEEIIIDPGHVETEHHLKESPRELESKSSTSQFSSLRKSTWKADAHALAVSYRIKRLKQQLIVMEKLSASEAIEKRLQTKGIPQVISCLNKQVKRYQSLEEKTDNLCSLMHENGRRRLRNSSNRRTKEQTKVLQGFLNDTFLLQRYVVAMGQKLTEIESRVKHKFVMKIGFDESIGFNIVQFSNIVRTLLKEVQRGLEVRIARIIGDLEGTLASDGILYK